MKAPAAKLLAESFLKGFFDVFDAMLSQTFRYTCSPATEADEEAIAGLLSEHPVQLSCVIQQGLGHVSVLLRFDDTAQVLSLLTGAAPEGALGDADKGTLREVADPALGGGVANVMDRIGRGVVQLDDVQVDDSGPAGAASLAAGHGGTAIAVPFTFDGGAGLAGNAVVLFSNGMDALIPQNVLDKETGGGLSQPALTQDELSDILGGFPAAGGTDFAPEPVHTAAPAHDRRAAMAQYGGENIDLVLDIRLLATARLGKMEMPLGDILNLGPGSILEIGHLVDEPIELLINDKLIARGDVVVVDEKFGLRITEILSQRERIESLR